jgi:hypothetical protein
MAIANLGTKVNLIFSMQHIEESLEKYERLRHRHCWWQQQISSEVKQEFEETDVEPCYYDKVSSKDRLLVCPGCDVLRQRKTDSLMWRDVLFTDPLWIQGK